MSLPTSQPHRAVILLIYFFGLFFASKLASDSFLPPTDEKGIWFLTCLASILLSNLLVEPFYSKPVDSLAYAATCVIALYLGNNWDKWENGERVLYLIAFAHFGFVIISVFAVILLRQANSESKRKLSASLIILINRIGNPAAVFSSLIVFSIFVFHRESTRETLVVTATWITIVAIRPEIRIHSLLQSLKMIWKPSIQTNLVGDIASTETPNIWLIRKHKGGITHPGRLFIVNDPETGKHVTISAGMVGREEKLLLRLLEFRPPKGIDADLERAISFVPPGFAASFDATGLDEALIESSVLLARRGEFIGLVGPESSLTTLNIELVREMDVREGSVVEVPIRNKIVSYQIVNGFTQEENVFQKNKYGFCRAVSKKIGRWQSGRRRFVASEWLPELNSPVFLAPQEDYTPTNKSIGSFPGTNFSVEVNNLDHLVTHNAAILGILGVGKTMLAVELVERLLADGKKVICLDLTDEYSSLLPGYYDREAHDREISELNEIGSRGKENCCRNVEEGGSVREFSDRMREIISNFVTSKSEKDRLRVFNPSIFEVWRQDSKPFQEKASMASLTPAGITRIITECVLECMQERGKTKKGRICIVYEEAHSLIPEWNSVVDEGDKSATNGTARAILQGRKFGFGCLLVTQRTANVTKSILNQCNSIFAMRIFDETGKTFLSDYIGRDYAEALPAIPERHAIAFGRALSCENPVLVQLNDRKLFTEKFRIENPPPLPSF